MSPGSLKLLIAGVAVALILTISATWKVQDWRYAGQLAEQANAHLSDLAKIGSAAADQVQAEQRKRLALEQQVTSIDQTHHRALTDAQRDQDRLRDRLATADLRLSVLLTEDSASCSSVPATAGAGGVVHGRTRAQLDPAHAQRIIAITDAGDRGLIALRACQAYVRALGQ